MSLKSRILNLGCCAALAVLALMLCGRAADALQVQNLAPTNIQPESVFFRGNLAVGDQAQHLDERQLVLG